LLLLSLLPAFVPARETAPRIDLRHGVRPDTIRLKAEDLKLGLPCEQRLSQTQGFVAAQRQPAPSGRTAQPASLRQYPFEDDAPCRTAFALPDALRQPRTRYDGQRTGAGRERQFERYSGRRIGEVVIAQDPVFTPDGNWLERTGNKLHVMTRERVLRRDLLFEPGDTIAPELLVRNLQLLRSRAYISDATMELTPDSLDSTRVVVTLRSRDSWTISADAALHGEGRTMIGLSDANIFGSGNRLSVATNFSRNDFGYGGNVVSYDIPNFLGSFYKANFSAGRDFYNSELRIGVGKEFILPTDYELGIAYNNVKAKYYLVDRDTSDLAKSKRFDVWAGRSRCSARNRNAP